MNGHDHVLSRLLLGAVLVSLCRADSLAQVNEPSYPPPVGARMVATLEADQNVYTNQAGTVWCPPCVTNSPPCMLPCYLLGRTTAVARFSFQVSNQYPVARTFEFPSSQQFDIELIDQTGDVVAAWSDSQVFAQGQTSFTLEPGQTVTFIGDIPLNDRNGQQLNGTYQARGFMTTSGPQPPVEATSQIAVAISE
jgi:hypothetical protein